MNFTPSVKLSNNVLSLIQVEFMLSTFAYWKSVSIILLQC